MTPTTNNVGPTTSATERLRALLDERGVEWMPIAWNPKRETFYHTSNGVGFCADEYADGVKIYTDATITPEQAVAATLGETPTPPPPTPPKQPPYDELIESLRRDWDIEASWDGLRRFWYVGWTDEHVRRCESVNLDQDWVRDLIERHSDASGGNGRDFHNGAYVAIADELNATLGSCNCSNSERTGTCHNAAPSYLDFLCSECGFVHYHSDTNDTGDGNEWHYCPNCGRKVVDE